MYGYGRDPYFDPYYGGMPPPMMPEPYPAPPVPPLPPMPPQMAAPPPMPAPPHPLVALESPSMDYYYPSDYSRSAYPGRPSSRTPFPPRPVPAGAMPPMAGPPPPSRPGPPPMVHMVGRQYAPQVGRSARSSSRGVQFDDNDEVIVYPAKKSKAQMWRKVSSKKLEREPEFMMDGYYDAHDMGYGPPPPQRAYIRR